MIYPRRQNQQITLLKPDSHPTILRVTDIEIPTAGGDVADLFVFMHMLLVEGRDFVVIGSAKGCTGNYDGVMMSVVAILDELFEFGVLVADEQRHVVMEDAEGGEMGWGEEIARILTETGLIPVEETATILMMKVRIILMREAAIIPMVNTTVILERVVMVREAGVILVREVSKCSGAGSSEERYGFVIVVVYLHSDNLINLDLRICYRGCEFTFKDC